VLYITFLYDGTSHLQAVMVRWHMVYSSEIYEVSHKMYPDSLLYQSTFYCYRSLMEPCGSSYISSEHTICQR